MIKRVVKAQNTLHEKRGVGPGKGRRAKTK